MNSGRRRKNEKVENMDYAERWKRDALVGCPHGDSYFAIEVDVSNILIAVDELKSQGVLRANYIHFIVHAVAEVLSKQPTLHYFVTSRLRVFPDKVDISLSGIGRTIVGRFLVIKDAAAKSVMDIVKEVARLQAEEFVNEKKELEFLRTWGRLLPFSSLRRWVCRLFIGRLQFRRDLAGFFQITSLPNVDLVVPLMFLTPAILGVGGVRDRVVAVNGKPEVRPTVNLSCVVDHKVWDGARANTFLQNLKNVIER